MKKVVLKYTGIILLLALCTNKVFAQEGFGTNTPDKSAVIDLDSEKRGLLIPRVNLTAINNPAPILTPAQSLLVYNKNTTTGLNGVSPGYYYWDTNRWVRFAQQTTAGNNITGTNITVTGGSGAALTDVSLKITPGTNGQILLTGASGEATWVNQGVLMPTVNNGLNYDNVSDTAQLGGPLITPTAITTTATNTLKVEGLQTGKASDNLVAVEPDGTLRQVTAAMPKFFYMPPIIFDTSTPGTRFTKDLHDAYVKQFGGTGNPTLVSSAGATAGIPTLLANALEYHITYYDTDVFENLSISANGVLTYDIKANATEASFMTIVFVVK